MCSARLCGEIVQQGKPAWFEHALTAHNRSESTQPANQVSTVQDECSTSWRREDFWEHLRECLTFEIDIGTRIAHRGIQASVAEPLADSREVYASLQQLNRGGMPKRMRVDFFVRKGWVPGARDEHVFAQQTTHAKSAHLSTAAINEDRQFGQALSEQGTSANEFAQKLRSTRLDRTHSHLVPFATQPDLRRWVEPQVTDLQIEDLLHTSPSVEHQRKQCKVALPRWTALVDGGQQCIDLSRFQIFDRVVPPALPA